MANPEHLEILKQGVEVWNRWRLENPMDFPDLSNSNLVELELNYADLLHADMSGSILNEVSLNHTKMIDANLDGSSLIRANLNYSNLNRSSLQKTNLKQAKLFGAKLSSANLTEAILSVADLSNAILNKSILRDAKLNGALIERADLIGSKLLNANLRGANLSQSNLNGADLSDSDLTGASLFNTIFNNGVLDRVAFAGANLNGTSLVNVDLSKALGLNKCLHIGPSIIDHHTLTMSRNMPTTFLRGIGLPDLYIDYLPSLFHGNAIQYYSCFISYSSANEDFAKCLHADLQDSGVRCWFAPEDMKIGDEIRTVIDTSIRLHDKLLLILSEDSVQSEWVKDEVESAYEKERSGQPALFPVRIDDAVLDTSAAWAAKLRRQRHIGDFTKWKEHDSYRAAFDRLLRDLKATGE